jgi:hypothetical protein
MRQSLCHSKTWKWKRWTKDIWIKWLKICHNVRKWPKSSAMILTADRTHFKAEIKSMKALLSVLKTNKLVLLNIILKTKKIISKFLIKKHKNCKICRIKIIFILTKTATKKRIVYYWAKDKSKKKKIKEINHIYKKI